jgi:hypothetical protein
MLAVHKFYNTDREARLNFVNWHLHWMDERVLESTLVLLRDETWSQPRQHVKAQNNSFTMLINEVQLGLLSPFLCLRPAIHTDTTRHDTMLSSHIWSCFQVGLLQAVCSTKYLNTLLVHLVQDGIQIRMAHTSRLSKQSSMPDKCSIPFRRSAIEIHFYCTILQYHYRGFRLTKRHYWKAKIIVTYFKMLTLPSVTGLKKKL